MDTTLNQIVKEAEEIAKSWNGESSGTQEDKAHCALELLEKVNEVLALLVELRE